MSVKYPSQKAPRITVITNKSMKSWLKRYAARKDLTISQVVLRELGKLRSKENNK